MAKRKRLTKKKLLDLRRRMLIHGTVKKNRYAEEIASEYVVRLLQGLHRSATVQQAYIDITRSMQVNGRSKYKDQQAMLEFSIGGTGTIPEQPSESDPHIKIDVQNIMKMIKGSRQRQVFQGYLEGKNFSEMANEMDVTESAVHQIFHREVKRLKELISRTAS